MDNLELMRKRLEFLGGIRQEDRMIKGKWWTLQKALLYSYQGCDTQLVQLHNQVMDRYPQDDAAMGVHTIARALINPDKLKQDYDDKMLSIDYQYQYNPGDVFEWVGTDSQWIIYTRELTEDAYFRGAIRRCRYVINFKDKDQNQCYTYAAIRGPVETQINSIQKSQVRIDQPNLTLNILMPLNEQTRDAFDRYSEFLLDGKCWRVLTMDTISLPNVLEITAGEYYIDRDTDDIDNEMKNGLVFEPIVEKNPAIVGPGFIKPKIAEKYAVDEPNGSWSVLEVNAPVKLCNQGTNDIEVIWDKITSGQFTLVWEKDNKHLERVIVVESLF